MMSTMRRSLIIGFAVLGAVLASALPAVACSCFQGDPRDQFAQAEAAIIGEYVSARPSEDVDEYEAIYTFNVQEEWKAEFGDTLDVYAAENGAACGIEAAPGQVVGLFLSMEGDEWHSNLCQQTSPKTMREATSPLPEPTSDGPTRMIVGGSFGEARVMALDADGETVAYGYGGDHDVFHMDACPGGKRIVEVWMEYSDTWETTLAIRRVSDLEVIEEVRLPHPQSKQLGGLDCRDRAAASVFVFVAQSYGHPKGTLYEVHGGEARVHLKDIDARYAAFGDRHVYYSGAKGVVWKMKLDGSKTKMLFETGKRVGGAPALSPDESHVAVVLNGTYEPARNTRLALYRMSDGQLERTNLSDGVSYGTLLWDGNRRLVVLHGAETGSRVFDLGLDVVGRFGAWYSGGAAILDGKVWGASYGELFKVTLPNGDTKRDRELPSPVNYALVSLPR